MVNNGRMIVDIKNCARCVNDHYQLEFEELYIPIDEYTYWAKCPDTEQPILLKIVDRSDKC